MRRLSLSAFLFTVAALASDLPPSRAVANRPVVDLYSQPSAESDVATQAIFGTGVDVLETDGKWIRVRTPDAYTGWAEQAQFVLRDKPYGRDRAVVVSNLYAHLYRERSINRHKPLLTVPFETSLEKGPGDDEAWIEVILPDAQRAWIQRGDVSEATAPLGIDAMIALSRRFLGLPYTWGGTSSFGYDCSGFTQMLERQRGISMPRDADQQAAWNGLRSVGKDELQPGDLLFFGSDPGEITHTGLYLGAGEFIHATAHERPVIQISRLGEERWTMLFAGARRVR